MTLRYRLTMVLAALLLLTLPSPAHGQASPTPATQGPAAQGTGGETPPQVRELLDLLAQPAVRDWLDRHRTAAVPAPGAAVPDAASDSATMPRSTYLAHHVAMLKRHLGGLAATVPKLPQELEQTRTILMLELEERGLLRVLLLVAGFVALGFGSEWLFWRAAAPLRRRIAGHPVETARDRLQMLGLRFAFGAGWVTAFAVGSIGAFLALDWPPLLREIVLGYLTGFFVLQVTLMLDRLILAPGNSRNKDVERFRIIPMSRLAARFWHRRIGLAVGWTAFGWVTLGLLDTLGVSLEARRLLAYALGLGLLAIGVETAWRRPRSGLGGAPGWRRAGVMSAWLVSCHFVLLWLLWVGDWLPAFWLVAVALALPLAVGVTRRALRHLLQPSDGVDHRRDVPPLVAAGIERGVRAGLIILAALLLARAWQVDLVDLTAGDTLAQRLARAGLNAIVIVLLADFAWSVIRAVIDAKLDEARRPRNADDEDARHSARLLTLLPILRNILFVLVLVMGGLTVLGALGVEIGPLVAGAGVVGIAVGFGAQTLVKDIFSGVFYLLDDAFRIGEYIQSSGHKGTVESFSLRSVKLRHHRGPLTTVPFGELGAVQNLSRDWVIDKLTVSLTYDTDLDKVKKLIKRIGQELADNPEFAPHIIEPLKMQGVEQFGDFAIQIRMKMMTRPGEQFVIRRRAYVLMKKAFDANGIRFAFPTVQLAGGGDIPGEAAAAAAAKQALELVKPAPAA